MELKSLIEITRPHNCLMGALTCVIGVLATDRIYALDLADLPASSLLVNAGLRFPSRMIEILVLTYLIYVFIAAAGNIINDIYDIDVDRINKPNRPLPRKALTLSQAKAFTVTLWFTGGALAFTISLISGIMAIVFAGLGYIYAARVKALGSLGNFAVASSFSFGMFFGAIVAAESRAHFILLGGDTFVFIPLVIWVYFLTSTFVLFGREVIKGIEAAANAAAMSNLLGIVFFNISWLMDGAKLITFPLVVAGSFAVLASAVFVLRSYRVPKAQSRASLLDKVGGFCGLVEFLLVNLIYAFS